MTGAMTLRSPSALLRRGLAHSLLLLALLLAAQPQGVFASVGDGVAVVDVSPSMAGMLGMSASTGPTGAATPPVSPPASPLKLTFAVVPQFHSEVIFNAWAPLLRRLGEDVGVELKLLHYESIPHFEADFLAGAADLIYLNPYHLVMARKAAGYEPLLSDAKTLLSGILVVRKDSPLQRLQDLDGHKAAFPAPNAFGASLYLRGLLQQRHGVRLQPVFRGTHSNVYRHVLLGAVAAGGGVRRTLEREPASVQEGLRIIHETPPSPPHPIAAHPRVPEALRAALQDAFIALGDSVSGRTLLAAVLMPQPQRVVWADYAPLEQLGLEEFVVIKAR